MIRVFTNSPKLEERLSRRSGMTVEAGPELLQWVDDSGWSRRIRQASGTKFDLGQVVELIDNNPLVCADEFDLTPAPGGMASLLLGPLLLVGMEPIVVHCETDFNIGADVPIYALDFPITTVSQGPPGLPKTDVLRMEIQFQMEPKLLEQEVFSAIEERFGRSFFVRPFYGLRERKSFGFAEAECSWVLQDDVWTASAECHREGKFGWAGTLHAFNVMIGAEESASLEF